VQYLSIRYTERVAEAGAACSVGSRGDSYDNALAEVVNGLYKLELICKRDPWRTLEHVELATAERVDWWNNQRLHSAIGDVPPVEYEAAYYHKPAPYAARVVGKARSASRAGPGMSTGCEGAERERRARRRLALQRCECDYECT
jgi:hypothetical protein